MVALVAVCCATSGCLGPQAVRITRMKYNEAYRSTNDEQLLMNIVRLRYADSPVFIDLPNITSQYEASAGGSYPGRNGGQSTFGYGGGAARETPTLSYHPREGREIARALLTPLAAELFSIVNAGANTEQLLLLTLNEINDVPNAPRATTMMPRTIEDNSQFRRGLALLSRLQDREAVELSVAITDETENSSDPVPSYEVGGRDLIDAAKEGYAFRAKGKDKSMLVKRERELILRVRSPFVDSPEMAEFASVFRLKPGLSQYKIKSELAEDVSQTLVKGSGQDTLYLNMRSVLQMMVFLSKGVCVPAEHVACGIAPTTLGPDGRPFDWTRVTSGVFFVHSSEKRPRESEVAVFYRERWYYIASNDVSSRAVLAILEILFSLQDSDIKPNGPMLTLPVGG